MYDNLNILILLRKPITYNLCNVSIVRQYILQT